MKEKLIQLLQAMNTDDICMKVFNANCGLKIKCLECPFYKNNGEKLIEELKGETK